MIPSSTIDFDVVEARQNQNGRSAAAGRVLFSFTSPAKLNQISLREVVVWWPWTVPKKLWEEENIINNSSFILHRLRAT